MKLITFEGCDGVGKTSQAFLLSERLRKAYRVYASMEPFGAPIFKNIRFGLKQILYDKDNTLCAASEMMLYLMSRTEHIRHIKSSTNSLDFVVLDRFTDSTEAYQCYGLGGSHDLLSQMNALLGSDIVPDLTFILDADYSAVACRQDLHSCYYESLGGEFYRKVREGFQEIAKRSSRYVIIDASQDISVVSSLITKEVERRFELVLPTA